MLCKNVEFPYLMITACTSVISLASNILIIQLELSRLIIRLPSIILLIILESVMLCLVLATAGLYKTFNQCSQQDSHLPQLTLALVFCFLFRSNNGIIFIVQFSTAMCRLEYRDYVRGIICSVITDGNRRRGE